ncbi:MAG: excinuclease ABC subunit UvrA [Planctomycetes bacterium]|nr:excinuclease ABC subunit UvrA [Planctomycetota bacterium]
MSQAARFIRVRGAAEHNLKSLDVDIPRDCMVVITGVSGSGKSSLAFDTIFAEGQRKYMESLSSYARQFLTQWQKPDVESIEGLPPTIAIQQRTGGHNPRSTVATITEIYDYLRVLYARCATPTCWARTGGSPARPRTCGRPIAATSATQIVDALMGFDGQRLMICAPVIRGKKGFHGAVIEGLQKHGFVRARVDGTIVDVRDALKEGTENPLGLARYEQHTIEAVVDRIVIKPDVRQRLADSVEVAMRLSDGLLTALVDTDGAWVEHRYSEKLACSEHPRSSLDELAPRLFSFNSPYGACRQCDGLGVVSEFDDELIVPDGSLGIGDGAIEPWRKNGKRMNMYYGRLMRRFCDRAEVTRTTPYEKLTVKIRRILMHGTAESDESSLGFTFEGVVPSLRRRYDNTDSDFVKEKLRGYMSNAECPACGGRRLRPESLHVLLPGAGGTGGAGGVSIADLTAMTIEKAIGFFEQLELSTERRTIAEPILREVQARLGFLASVGLNYLTLDRTAGTLSGGEAQRIRLATQVGSGLVGVCYVLDEPTIGLHHRDNDRLIATLRHLADIGNTVLIVEHDEGMIRAADHIIDIGPGPGHHGGTVMAQGTVQDILDDERSLTGAYLSGRRRIQLPRKRRELDENFSLVVKGARQNNLKSIDVVFPLGGLICVTGVSGSGKSTLVNDILFKAACQAVHGSRTAPGAHARVNGLGRIDRVVQVNQSPIGRTPRSNPATYTGIFDDIRRLFTRTTEARIRGYAPGRFSFNVKGGRCEACQGQGVKKIEMHFLPDIFVTCEVCQGARYNRETLEVTYRHKTIADVLAMPVEEAIDFFEAHTRTRRMLQCLGDVGLEYLHLGQPSTTLSGGEAQRIKLAAELGNQSTGHTLYVLDEPTTGLHFADIEKLLSVFDRLAEAGNTLVVIEHNLDVVKSADWIIDLGPEGGARGGMVVATGTPEDVAASRGSHTGRYLKPLLGRRNTRRTTGSTTGGTSRGRRVASAG